MTAPGPIGQRIDRYQVEVLLGAGGFGAVYRARHVHTDALVALKVLKKALGADPQMVERFLREARAAAAVGSDHIVRVLDAGQDPQGIPFLALELLEGVDLQGFAQRDGPLPAMRVVLLCLQVLDGLEAAHRKGIVHRDMKPANVFVVRRVDERGTERDFVKLLDFGISKMLSETGSPTSGLTMTGMAMGTPSYMAPEQFFDARSVDARADVYSVAVMMYELLSGKLPIEATSYADLIVKVRTEQPVHLALVSSSLPRALADAVMVGLAKEKEQRWASARDFAGSLRTAMELPQAGHTPIPPRAVGAAVGPNPMDTPSMMMGATAKPQRASPMPDPTGSPAPGPLPQPPTPAPAAWAVPQSSPAPLADVTPAPGGHQPVRTSGPGRALKWTLGVLGALSAMCCSCFALSAFFGETTTPAASRASPSPPVIPDVTDQPVFSEGDALARPDPAGARDPQEGTLTPEELAQLREGRPRENELLDALRMVPQADGADLPSREEVLAQLQRNGMSPARIKKVMRVYDRMRALVEAHGDGPMTPKETAELEKLLSELHEL